MRTEEKTYSTSFISSHEPLLKMLRKHQVSAGRMLDLGCFDGQFTSIMARQVGAMEVYGIDMSEEALHRVAGLTKVIRLDLSDSQLPFPNEYFDLVTAVEVIEHLPYGDSLVSESFRVLKEKGYFVVATPNLGSWINRILILLGYHPTGITLEPSRQYIIGLPTPVRKKSGYVGHISAYNLRGLSSLLSAYGFKVIDKVGVALKYRQSIIELLDRVMSTRPSLASGLVVLARKKSFHIDDTVLALKSRRWLNKK